MWPCLGQPSLLCDSAAGEEEWAEQACLSKGRDLQSVSKTMTPKICHAGGPSSSSRLSLEGQGPLGVTYLPGTRKSLLFAVSAWTPTQENLTNPPSLGFWGTCCSASDLGFEARWILRS